MPNRIRQYLNTMDVLRDETDVKVDEMLSNINIKQLLAAPEKSLTLIILTFLKKNNKFFKQASTEGTKLANSLGNGK